MFCAEDVKTVNSESQIVNRYVGNEAFEIAGNSSGKTPKRLFTIHDLLLTKIRWQKI